MNAVVWLLLIVGINSDGSVTSVINAPNKPEYNNEASCNEAGKAMAAELQMKMGTNNIKLFWKCSPMPYKDLVAAMPNA